MQTNLLEARLFSLHYRRSMFLLQHHRSKDGKEHAYWSLVETVRTPDGPRQRTICYLGELNDSAQARWQKTIEVFNEQGEHTQLKVVSERYGTPRRPECSPGSGEKASRRTDAAVWLWRSAGISQ